MEEHEQLRRLARASAKSLPDAPLARQELALAVAAAARDASFSVERLGAALGRVLGEEPLEAATSWQLGDLHLAAAALEGIEDAVREVEGLLAQATAEALGSRGFSRHEIDEVAQELMSRLLVGDQERAAKLSSYSGRGRLGGFLRSAAIRAGLNLRRGEHRQAARTLALEFELETVLDDPEVRHLKEVYLESFRAALRAAWEGLDAGQQLLLRHQLEDRLTIDELARLQGVHRATAARRLVAARDQLASATRRQLEEQLGLAPRDVESVMMLIHSRLGDAVDVLT